MRRSVTARSAFNFARFDEPKASQFNAATKADTAPAMIATAMGTGRLTPNKIISWDAAAAILSFSPSSLYPAREKVGN